MRFLRSILQSYLHESWAAGRQALTYGLMLHSKISTSHSQQILTKKMEIWAHMGGELRIPDRPNVFHPERVVQF